ncbi:nucleoside triphosphate pyrophosphohydrolase [Vermiphilus pyriformis]|nr:MAG: nucleoside triphosphate pyrophosphohydrolase [Vermiphilus pyriformis]
MARMRKFTQNKLWRDKVIDQLQTQGSIIDYIILDSASYSKELKSKLIEEAHEVQSAHTRETIIAELADVFEVVDALCKVYNIERNDITLVQNAKRDERGGFLNRKYVVSAQHVVGSMGEAYCLNDPDKYPEIIE